VKGEQEKMEAVPHGSGTGEKKTEVKGKNKTKKKDQDANELHEYSPSLNEG